MGNFVFGEVPVIKHSRSRFDLSHQVKTSGNVGTLYPFDVQEVYAGDTFKVKTAIVSRLASQFIRPVMDNLFLDVYYFFVPSRILYDKFVNIFGENTESPWANTAEYEVPSTPLSGCVSGSVGDYLGLPVGASASGEGVSLLPFRAFAKIYDDWFRDENNVSPMHIQKGEATSSETLNNNDWSPSNYTGKPPKVAKFHDLFTSALPAPQKGTAPEIPVTMSGRAPVTTIDELTDVNSDPAALQFYSTSQDSSAAPAFIPENGVALGFDSGDPDLWVGRFAGSNAEFTSTTDRVYPANLWAMVGGADVTSGITVNDLRLAFQYQKMLERDSRSGTRFVEYLKAHFGVSAGDYRLQRSEFLGGRRSPISIHQVTQTTGEGSDSSPLGSVGAFSLSNALSRYTKGFVENGYVIGVFCIRQFHTYQQGLEKFWSKFKRTDFYDPVFANIGEQPTYTKELWAGNSTDSPAADTVFGYNEAFIDLRYRPSRVSGQMRTGVTNSLDVWHFGDFYQNAPVLGQQFIEETPDYVNRAITVESSQQDQFILDIYIQNVAYRPLPTYSIPSLVDHN